MVLRTFGLHDNYVSIWCTAPFEPIAMQQSCKIFVVEMYLKNKPLGAEHRNI
jgi:hypothetical protein